MAENTKEQIISNGASETATVEDPLQGLSKETYKEKYGFHKKHEYAFTTGRGLNEEVIRAISAYKQEPDWMLAFRLKAYEAFKKMPMPTWGGDLSEIDFDAIQYYLVPSKERHTRSWDEVPDYIKETFEKLGIPEAERKYLAGVEAQYDSESVYSNLREDLAKQGVIFCSTDEAVQKYPDLLREYFGTVIPYTDNKFAALNSAVWSGGSFIYVPPGVKVEIPLQAYFRINAEEAGQFERTLIIVDEGAQVNYVEGCTAPVYARNSLHAAVVEIIVKANARCRYTTIQNWSHNVYNLVTKRAKAYRNAVMEWIDGNIGSRLTMKYPAVILAEEGAHGEVLSVAYAGDDQHQDTGAKMIHLAPNTSSVITSKSISKGTGRSTYRGLVKVTPAATNARVRVECDALLLHENSRTDTYPTMEIQNDQVDIGHEASVSKVGEEQLFYLMSRGISEDMAASMIVSGFIEPIVRELPMEYAAELNRLIQLEMEGSVG